MKNKKKTLLESIGVIASERLSNKTSSRTSFTDGPEKQNASILQSQEDVFVAWTVHLNILTPCLVLLV